MQNDETTSARSLKPFCRSSVFIQRFAFVLLALLALVVRLPQLAERPMHTDEAVNGYILGEILDGQSYQYDPQDKHGPFLFALATPVARLCGAKHFADLTETQLRLTPAIFSALAILLFGTGVRVFGFIPCVVGAILFAIAPISVYYGRYFIHETLFVAATLGLLIFGWRMLRDNSLTAAALTGLFAAIALASKETVVINFMALAFTGGAMLLVRRMERKTFAAAGQASRLSPTSLESSDLRHARRLSYAVATGVFAVATILLFTWGGRHWQALADLFRGVPLFTARARGQGHEKPFQYYFTV
ncbi:MAG TPA: glycosyltransferase family 39 protein, partial [Verrucomicrobiota bacterium]|nr:glycosyltransferase family 39 protein [Verrucomicrobiota bacterium]